MTNEKKLGELKTTGQLRTMLANAAKGVMQGQLDLDKALALHKLAKNISDSLYSETKIAMFRREADLKLENFGEMLIGDPSDKIDA
jgi:hypothetical protein